MLGSALVRMHLTCAWRSSDEMTQHFLDFRVSDGSHSASVRATSSPWIRKIMIKYDISNCLVGVLNRHVSYLNDLIWNAPRAEFM